MPLFTGMKRYDCSIAYAVPLFSEGQELGMIGKDSTPLICQSAKLQVATLNTHHHSVWIWVVRSWEKAVIPPEGKLQLWPICCLVEEDPFISYLCGPAQCRPQLLKLCVENRVQSRHLTNFTVETIS